MAYFDGGIHGYNAPEGYIPAAKQTRLYCDDCAEATIPLPEHGPHGDRVGRHWATPFKWAPRYGSPCQICGKDC